MSDSLTHGTSQQCTGWLSRVLPTVSVAARDTFSPKYRAF
ncbi:MAG: hypothetical protein IKM79_07730 [Bacteroidales bacterium]|nr:hypothetical protein [Bacteroidales bacterium]